MIRRYVRWLHTGWPAGTVERLPIVGEGGQTNVPGLRVVGDLTGIPLLKFSADTGARAVQAIAAELAGAESDASLLDLVIVGGGVSGMAAALEARKLGLSFELLEASEPFSTVVNFPKGKPIYTYPTGMTPAGDLQFTAEVKETLLEEMRAQTLGAGIEPRIGRAERVTRRGNLFEVALPGEEPLRCRRVVVGIGRSGNFRKLGVPGEELGKVGNRLYDPQDHTGQDVLVVGGGDSALEAAIALVQCGARVHLSYRKPEFSRPKPENVAAIEALVRDPDADVQVEEPSSDRVTPSTGRFLKQRIEQTGSLELLMGSTVEAIEADQVTLSTREGERTIANQAVFSMIGREAPLDFFRRSGVKIRGEWTPWSYTSFFLFVACCVFIYNWKSFGQLNKAFQAKGWFPYNLPELASDKTSLLGTLSISLREPGFYYSIAYCLCVLIFGVRRIRKRKTPYVTAQTWTLIAIQCIPLFLLPYLVLPYLGHNGAFDAGGLKTVADGLFPTAGYGHGREYWRTFGLILAWPLFFWNVFTSQPMWWWLAISLVQTFLIIPLLVWRWGKGAYCGWICSCGALAETLGDEHRHKMPHGPVWNRVNLVGQVALVAALALLVTRLISWATPTTAVGRSLAGFYEGLFLKWSVLGIQLNYYYVVDLTLAGIVGVGFYFWFSGRVWCRFACPLAALMHIYARFSRFRIISDKKKCISCNVCTSVCHQGIDVMNFANKGLPMEDPQCVRCSACVESCPTGVLAFGQIDRSTGEVLGTDALAASPVRTREKRLPVV